MRHLAQQWLAIVLGTVLVATAAAAQNDGADAAPAAPAADAGAPADLAQWIHDFLGFGKNLRFTPKLIAANDGGETLGVEYRYERRILPTGIDLDAYFESSGTVVIDRAATPETRLQHKLRLDIVDLFGSQRRDRDRYRLGDDFVDVRKAYTDWRSGEGDERTAARTRLDAAWSKAADHQIGPVDTQGDEDPGNDSIPEIDALMDAIVDQGTTPFVSLEVDLGAESDQEFADFQWVGGGKLRAKLPLLGEPLDAVCRAIRGYAAGKVAAENFDRGPYLWAGVDLIDASDNESRKALVDDDQYARLQFGAFWRNEIFRVDTQGAEPTPVALELEWRYYRELGAQQAVIDAGDDATSWVRAGLLLPHDVLVEYTDGRQPLDRTGGTRLFVGWRFGF